MKILVLLFAAAILAVPASPQVPYDHILNADQHPGDWLTYSRNYTGQRYSPLNEITTANVNQLQVKWAFQFPDSFNEVSPIVVGNVIYLTGPNSATALDAQTGRTLWKWSRPIPADFHPLGFYSVNRGPAVLDDQLYVTTLDCYLVALDLKSGIQRWAVPVADYKLGYSMTLAPLAIDGKILVGVSGGEAGIRGLVDAYDAKSGQRLWRFWTVPAPGDSVYKTWAGDSARYGGGPTWVTGVYDPQLNLVYWGVGNPGPDWNGDVRLGDNLYTCSFVALDAATGQLRWHFQFTPHDTHDWDASQVPVLFDAKIKGQDRRLIATANRNGFYYVLDRVTGEFLAAQPYAKQTWARGIDAHGRPILAENSEPTEQGTLTWPNANGASVWYSPSYSPQTNLFYVAVRNTSARHFKRAQEFQVGTMYLGGGEEESPQDSSWGELKALDPTTGDMRWTFRLHTPPWAGVLSTAGHLVFSGTDEGNFYALDAANGKPLWDFQTGGRIGANPLSFSVAGHQFVAISADRVFYVFGL